MLNLCFEIRNMFRNIFCTCDLPSRCNPFTTRYLYGPDIHYWDGEMNSRGQFFIISAIFIVIVIMFFSIYSTGLSRMATGSSSSAASSQLAFDNIREGAKETVSGAADNGDDINDSVFTYRNFSINKLKESNYDLDMDYSINGSELEINMSLESPRARYEDRFGFSGFYFRP